MQPSDIEHAHQLGSRLASLALAATVALLRAVIVGVRVTLVVCFSAWLWHAIVPGMAFGAWAVIFLASYAIAWPAKVASREIRRAVSAGRARWTRRARKLADSRTSRA
jgi:Kef-type K+ transport system membrane component KefB